MLFIKTTVLCLKQCPIDCDMSQLKKELEHSFPNYQPFLMTFHTSDKEYMRYLSNPYYENVLLELIDIPSQQVANLSTQQKKDLMDSGYTNTIMGIELVGFKESDSKVKELQKKLKHNLDIILNATTLIPSDKWEEQNIKNKLRVKIGEGIYQNYYGFVPLSIVEEFETCFGFVERYQ